MCKQNKDSIFYKYTLRNSSIRYLARYWTKSFVLMAQCVLIVKNETNYNSLNLLDNGAQIRMVA